MPLSLHLYKICFSENSKFASAFKQTFQDIPYYDILAIQHRSKKSAMKNILFLLVFTAFIYSAPALAQSYDQTKVQLQFFNHYGRVAQKGKAPSANIGSEFLYDDWKAMDITFKDTTVRFDEVKINLFYSNLEVLYNGEEKIIDNRHFRHVSLPLSNQPQKLTPANRFSYGGKALEGFVEIIGEGETKVLIQHHLYIKEPNPQANIVGGHTANKLMSMSDNYLFDGESLTLIKKKKDLTEYYRKQSKALDQYLKTHKPDLKDPRQLLALVEKMNPK